jgi:hypothetical protein
MRIRMADGTEVHFNQVASVSMKREYAAIERGKRERVVKVTADVNEAIINANELRLTMASIFYHSI